MEGYEPDPSIKAEPIQNGRNGKGKSQPRSQNEGHRRSKPSTKKSANAKRESKTGDVDGNKVPAKPKHKHTRRTSGNSQANSQHRHSRSGQSEEWGSLMGGGFRNK